tara:strand:- start:1738 stop:2118 length:381 start_codon:yes stop_codon:yes gene_type:complete
MKMLIALFLLMSSYSFSSELEWLWFEVDLSSGSEPTKRGYADISKVGNAVSIVMEESEGGGRVVTCSFETEVTLTCNGKGIVAAEGFYQDRLDLSFLMHAETGNVNPGGRKTYVIIYDHLLWVVTK